MLLQIYVLAPVEEGAVEGVADDGQGVGDVDGDLGQVVLRAGDELDVEALLRHGLHEGLGVLGGAGLCVCMYVGGRRWGE